jgi:hypothetical protein
MIYSKSIFPESICPGFAGAYRFRNGIRLALTESHDH